VIGIDGFLYEKTDELRMFVSPINGKHLVTYGEEGLAFEAFLVSSSGFMRG
jgi:hypothetical protein